MNSKLVSTLLVLLASLLFPYMVSLAVLQSAAEDRERQLESEKRIYLEDGSSISAESYLVRVLAAQIEPDAEMEALKAQAVLARTWLFSEMGELDGVQEADVGGNAWTLSGMKAQWQENFDAYYDRLYEAVLETRGECAFYDGSYILPLYHGVSPGMTRADASGSCPYLVSVECYYDAESPKYQQVLLLTGQELLARLASAAEGQEGSLLELPDSITAEQIVLVTDAAGYVVTAQFGDAVFTGDALCEALGTGSAWIRFEDYAQGIRIICRGQGHGYGLSQWGANRFAQDGREYRWILSYYFHDISIEAV